MHHIQRFLHSFKLPKLFMKTVLYDTVFIGIFGTFFFWLTGYLQQQSLTLLQGKSPTELQQMFATMPEQVTPFLGDLRGLLFVMLLGLFTLIIGGFLFFVWTRYRMWHAIYAKKRRKYRGWIVLHLALLIPLIMLILFILIIVGGVSLLTSGLPVLLGAVLTSIVRFALLLSLLVYIFLVYENYLKKASIWLAIGDGFQRYKISWRKIVTTLLYAVTTALFITLAFLPFQQQILYNSAAPLLYVVIVVLFLNWFRLYFLQELHHGT
jgi:hypothetical protein